MDYEMRVAADELMQLALWLEMLSRTEGPPSQDQLDLVGARVEAGLRKVKVLKGLGGEGVSPD